MKPLKNILISTLLLSSLAYTANIISWKANYSSGSDVWIELEDKPNNAQDWVGIYPAGSTNDWDNVVEWKWAKDTSPTQVDQGDWYKFQLDDGKYEARFFLNNSFTLNDKVSFSVEANNNTVVIGARPVKATPKNKAKLFASPNGQGDCMSYGNACDIYTAIRKLSQTNNVLFLRGGNYYVSKELVIPRGAQNKNIIIESYPNEQAVIVGDKITRGFYLGGKNKYAKIRKLEIKNFGGKAITLMRTSYVSIEGCKIYDNKASGISIYESSNNTITDNISYNNIDEHKGNADGIQIPYGNAYSENNKIIHNTVYNNSDDGIDGFGGKNTIISYNLSYNNIGAYAPNGNGGGGNGIGIKACSKYSLGGIVEHNIAFGNYGNGIECQVNSGKRVVFANNTSYDNGKGQKEDNGHGYGFGLPSDSAVTLNHNISSNNYLEQVSYGHQSENSWGIAEKVPFISTNINSTNFLRPEAGSVFENMGAYAR
jgi:parallel beta-helix repeat protein